jgi:hypothetical protein
MKSSSFVRFTFLSLWLLSANVLTAQNWKITLKAGEFDRNDTVVEFTAPEKLRGSYILTAPMTATIPLQIDDNGHAVFIEPLAAKGTTKTYTLSPVAVGQKSITVQKDGAVLKVINGTKGTPMFHYQTDPAPVPPGVDEAFRHGAFLHPVFTPNGHLVTANHPPDHLHQRGIFFAWTKTEFEGGHPDFWNMGKGEDGKLTGEVRFEKVERTWDGTLQGGFVSRHRFIDHTSGAEKDVLEETWEVTATRLLNANLIDLVSTQTITGKSPLLLPKYYYGGLGVRGPAAWDPVDKVTMLTSESGDRKTGDNSKARWVFLGGKVDGEDAGIAVLIHPGNFRFPQPLRLNPKNPQLSVAPSQEGDWEITPGKPYISKYRFVIADRAADAKDLERQWNDYANPPVVEVAQLPPAL